MTNDEAYFVLPSKTRKNVLGLDNGSKRDALTFNLDDFKFNQQWEFGV